ncbi:acyl-CoA dehydratase activase-related protein [Acetonema longum]|uniref:DUF2229 domain-containing protein n=1 Tax=Acetonema longum DSM 6540 TaxID=1009370 RepID=F7NQD1_9FIRM|nr:acyl-CoA dehydratase activase-related protein [Acetonema longum]EGO61748.1 hypothetical protein ALO_21846 [Acetonema longum DSM 6540]
MIVTFPHMGHLDIVLETLLSGLGCRVKVPPPVTKRTLELGTKYSPETVCLPFKILLGNFIEALETGADTILTCGGTGPCRLGYYAAVQQGILKQLGYSCDFIAIEPTVRHAYQILRQVAPRKSWRDIYRAFCLAGSKMRALDSLAAKGMDIRPREQTSGAADRILRQAGDDIREAQDTRAVDRLLREAAGLLEGVQLQSDVIPLRIGLIGEIYVMLEPFVNQSLVRQLSGMGVEVHQTLNLTSYVDCHLLHKPSLLARRREIMTLAKPYLGHYVGGHGINGIGHTLELGRKGVDGMIHVFPFTCMPEVVVKNILPRVSQDTGLPVLSLAFDEQTGEAGVITRLEAFVDLLRRRRQARQDCISGG